MKQNKNKKKEQKNEEKNHVQWHKKLNRKHLLCLCVVRFLCGLMIVCIIFIRVSPVELKFLPFRASDFTSGFWFGSCCSLFSFLCNVLHVIVYPVGLFLFVIGFVVLLRITDSHYLFGIFKLFLHLLS